MGKFDKFFAFAKEKGLSDVELYISEDRSLSASMFHGAIEKVNDNNGMSVMARGVLNGKCGSASCDVWNNEKAAYLVEQIVANAGVIENDDPVFIFKGSEKYHKVSTFNNDLEKVTLEEKLAKLAELEKATKEFDKRIVEVAEVGFEESTSKVTLVNSNGLKLFSKSNYFVYYTQCVAKEGEQTKSNFDLILENDFSKFDPKEVAKRAALGALEQLGGEPCESNKYKAVLDRDVVMPLISVLVGHASAEEVQKKSSLFIGKLGQKIVSKKITIEDKPLAKSIFARWFDDEGVATYNKPIIKNGVLETYLYNLTTAAKDGVTTTANGFGGGSKKGISSPFLVLKPGKKSLEELFQEVGNGVYITGVTGLHAGMNPQSGNFSLQAEGFLIKDGKKDRGLDIITVSGNLLEVFSDVVEVGSDVKVASSGISSPSLLIKKIAVSGK